MLRSIIRRALTALTGLAAIASFGFAGPARADDAAPIVVFPLASSAEDVVAAQAVTTLVAQRIRFVYGERAKLVTSFGDESLATIVKRVGAKYYVGGTVEKATGGYSVDLQGRQASDNALEGEQRFTMTTTTDLPKDLSLTALLDSNPLVANSHYVLVPLELDKSMGPSDTYTKWTQDDLVKRLQLKGITATVVPAMDPVDARLGAGDLCRDNNATGVIVGRSWHKQDYKEGAFKGGAKGFERALDIVPVAGPIVAGVVNATTNAVASVGGSDDKYPSYAEVDLTLLNCEGKRVTTIEGTGETSHFSGHNVASGETGAIDLAVSSAVDGIATGTHH
jgi:hypothetical protein